MLLQHPNTRNSLNTQTQVSPGDWFDGIFPGCYKAARRAAARANLP
jgi:hypothetical protein